MKASKSEASSNHMLFNLTHPAEDRFCFGEVFSVACVLLLVEDSQVHFQYMSNLKQEWVAGFFEGLFEKEEIRKKISKKKSLSGGCTVSLNKSHELIFHALKDRPDILRLDFTDQFTSRLPARYMKVVHQFVASRLENAWVRWHSPKKAVIFSVRNSSVEPEKNLTLEKYHSICATLVEEGVDAVFFIGDPLPKMPKQRKKSKVLFENTFEHLVARYPMIQFVNFCSYDKGLSSGGVPNSHLFQAQVYFISQLKARYQINVAVGASSGGVHMLGLLGLNAVFEEQNSNRFSSIRCSPENTRPTFFPFSEYSGDLPDGLEARLRSAFSN
jgi:hypothetical protein